LGSVLGYDISKWHTKIQVREEKQQFRWSRSVLPVRKKGKGSQVIQDYTHLTVTLMLVININKHRPVNMIDGSGRVSCILDPRKEASCVRYILISTIHDTLYYSILYITHSKTTLHHSVVSSDVQSGGISPL
jgi:hypothetical protein